MTDKMTPSEPAELATTGGIDWNDAIQKAITIGTGGVEVLERLQAMQREEEAVAAKRAFVRAMVALRAEMPPIEKTVVGAHGATKKGGRTHGMYAPLDTITRVLDPLCAKHGLVYEFDREVVEGRDHDYIVCIITHAGGYEKRTRYPAPIGSTNKATNALMAVAIGESYAKRYALTSAFGITTADPDEDGNMGNVTPLDDDYKRVTEEQAANIRAKLEELGKDEARFLRYVSTAWGYDPPLKSVDDIPASNLPDVWRVKGMS